MTAAPAPARDERALSRVGMVLVGAMCAAVLVADVGALWHAASAVRRADLHVLEAETSTAARVLREPDGAARVTRTLGTRWRRTDDVDPLLAESTIDWTADGRPVGRAPLFDADDWDMVGQVVVSDDETARPSWPSTVVLGWLPLVAGLAYVAWLCARHLWASGGQGALAGPAAIWFGMALALSQPVLAWSGSWAMAALRADTDRRLLVAVHALEGRSDLGELSARPSGIQNLTGLRFVPLADGTRAPAPLAPASGFAPDVARAIAALSRPVNGRVTVDRVDFAVADVGPVRLVMLPYEHSEQPASAMWAMAAVGALAGVPLLALVSVARDARRLRRELVAWSFLAPGLLHLVAFTLAPLVFAGWLSLHRWSLIDAARPFVGLENYAALAGNGAFWNALANTALFTLHVPVSMALALGLALLVRRRSRTSTVARAVFFLPAITSLVAIAMVWQWLLHDEYGLVNTLLGWMGVAPLRWLSSPALALPSIMIVATWTTLGFQTVLFQAGLTAIPRELYEAARIDGARAWSQFVHVTLPGLRPTLFFVLVTSVIGSFQVFGTVYVMTGGGPLHATDVAVFHIYEEAWELQRVGSAAAMSWVLFAVIFVVTWAHFRVLERRAG